MAKVEKVYCCNDCKITFAIRSNKPIKNVHCPYCGDWIAVNHKGHKGKLWTAEDIKILLDMQTDGNTHMQIAAVLKRSMRSVQHKVQTLRREGEIKPVVRDRKCTLCDEKHRCRGYCKKHYEQWVRGTLRDAGGNERE